MSVNKFQSGWKNVKWVHKDEWQVKKLQMSVKRWKVCVKRVMIGLNHGKYMCKRYRLRVKIWKVSESRSIVSVKGYKLHV